MEKIDNINKSIEISKKNKDILQKNAVNLFLGTMLEYFGLKASKIVGMTNVELPVVEVSESAMDSVLVHEDGSLTHFEFTTEYKKDDLPRFCEYDLRVYRRENKEVKTIIIYSSEVQKIDESLKMGNILYCPTSIMMSQYNGNKICADLEEKLKTGEKLSETDMLNLVFLPLMKWDKTGLSRKDLTVKAIEMAKTITDTEKRTACIASAVVFSHKYLNETELKEMLGVIRMTDLGTMLIEEGIEKGIEEGIEKGRLEKAIETAINFLKMGLSVDQVAKGTGLELEKVQQAKDSLPN